jgi:hypothetical protein
MLPRIQMLPDWMYHAIEESVTCQFTTVTQRGIPVALPVILNHFDPDTGTLVVSSPSTMKRVENVRQRPEVALLFSPVGKGAGEPPHVVLAQGRAEVDDADPENGWRRYFAGWARRHPPSRANLATMSQAMPGYVRRALLRVRPRRFVGWVDGELQRVAEVVEVTETSPTSPTPTIQEMADRAQTPQTPQTPQMPQISQTTPAALTTVKAAAPAVTDAANESHMVVWTDELSMQLASFSRGALSYSGQDGYPVTLPVPFIVDRVAQRLKLPVPIPVHPLASAAADARQSSLTLLRYDPQVANERYLLCYGQLAVQDGDWTFTPSRVVLR